MDDEYIVEEFSDNEYDSSSSDDDVQTFLKKECGLLEVEDDFETEVDKVMTAHLKKLKGTEPDISEVSEKEQDSQNQKNTKRAENVNDDLLYDPNLDDEDEKWVNEKRRSYIFPKETKNSTASVKPLPSSDAVLNCPACLALLCMDCQRHQIYKSQYRAMFVSNCNVIDSETLTYSSKKKKYYKKSDEENSQDKDSFNPVRCSVCNTEVAVYDVDEVYHFFNVLASY